MKRNKSEFKYDLVKLRPGDSLHSNCMHCGNRGVMYLVTMFLGRVLDIDQLRIDICPKCNHATVYGYGDPFSPAIVALPSYWRQYVKIKRP